MEDGKRWRWRDDLEEVQGMVAFDFLFLLFGSKMSCDVMRGDIYGDVLVGVVYLFCKLHDFKWKVAIFFKGRWWWWLLFILQIACF